MDWHSLRGKVVVLEFWATWCVKCVVELPDFNKLAASLDPARFQFISVDDEDPKVVQGFLAKRTMAGWVGIDTTSGVFKRYGIVFRPTTIIVDGQGRIVVATNPENLTAADLLAVADGKSVNFDPFYNKPAPKDAKAHVATAKVDAPPTPLKPLYEVSLSKAAPDATPDGMTAGPGQMELYAWSADRILCLAYGNVDYGNHHNRLRSVPEDRLLLTSPLPEGRYNLHTVWSSADDNSQLVIPLLQENITYGLNLRVQWKTVTKKSYVLKATKAGNTLLKPTVLTNRFSWSAGYWKGKIRFVNGSMDDLANGLEMGLEVPVVNETGIEGNFDAELEFPAKDAEAAKATLKTLGLELIEAERPIQMLEVSPREEAKKAEEAKPQQAPKP